MPFSRDTESVLRQVLGVLDLAETRPPEEVLKRADGWDLSIETDDEGRIAPGTRLVFPLLLARGLRCRPEDRDSGYLRTTTQAGAGELGGRFLVKLATCENAATGKVIEWPAYRSPSTGASRGCHSRGPRTLRRVDGAWKLARVFSFDHRPAQ